MPAVDMREIETAELASRVARGDLLLPSRSAWQNMLETEVDRRTINKYLAGTVLAAIFGTEAIIIRHEGDAIGKALDEQWPVNKPTFTFLGGELYGNQREIGIFFPGFGDMNSQEEAQLWKTGSELSPKMPTAFLDYSNQGTTVKHLADLIRSSIDISKLDSITLFGRSLGGPIEIAVATELGVPVRSMILCSSPLQVRDGDYASAGNLVADIPNNRGLATIAKYFVSLWRSSDASRGSDIATRLANAWQSTMSGASPAALQAELKAFSYIKLPTSPKSLDKAMYHSLHKVFIPGFTQVIYAASNDPSTDRTVHVVDAAKEYGQFFNLIGIEDFKTVGIPYDGHANVEATVAKLKPWIQATSVTRLLAAK